MKDNLNYMMGLDIFLSRLSKSESGKISKHIAPLKYGKTPLISWDLCSQGILTAPKVLSVNSELSVLAGFAKKFNWKINLVEILNSFPYQAIVLTDNSQKIIWVNDGFVTMTGYPKSRAINHTPSFLQGPETTEESANRIRKKIKLDKPFSEVIINYRKDKTMYKCELKIFPLITDKTTHFLALEREVA